MGESNVITKEELIGMFGLVADRRDVTYITMVTSIGPVKCSNLNNVKFKMVETSDNGPIEIAYDYRWDSGTLHEVSELVKQANAVNMGEFNTVYKILSHKIYVGEIDVVRPKTEIEFYDSYMLIKGVEVMDESFKHLIIRYSDFEYMFTQ